MQSPVKIAIIGGCPSTQDITPPPHFEIWVHGNQFDRHENKKVDKIFEIHNDLSEHDDIYPQWLVDKKIPMVVGEEFPIKAEHIEVYPYREANDLMGEHLTSTPAYMMAYALLKKATHINIYGVDMAVDDHEYFHQRPAMYAWIGYAIAKGVKIFIPEESPLFVDNHMEGKNTLKGVKPFTESQFLEMAEQHGEKVLTIQSQIRTLESHVHTHNGSKQSYERMAKVARAVESGQKIETITESAVLK